MCLTGGWSLVATTTTTTNKLLPRWISIVHFCSFTSTIIFFKCLNVYIQSDGYSASCSCDMIMVVSTAVNCTIYRQSYTQQSSQSICADHKNGKQRQKMVTQCHVIYFTGIFSQAFQPSTKSAAMKLKLAT